LKLKSRVHAWRTVALCPPKEKGDGRVMDQCGSCRGNQLLGSDADPRSRRIKARCQNQGGKRQVGDRPNFNQERGATNFRHRHGMPFSHIVDCHPVKAGKGLPKDPFPKKSGGRRQGREKKGMQQAKKVRSGRGT